MGHSGKRWDSLTLVEKLMTISNAVATSEKWKLLK